MNQVRIHTTEFHNMMDFFERTLAKGRRVDKEDRDIWEKAVYQDGEVNKLFFAFWNGVNYGIHESW